MKKIVLIALCCCQLVAAKAQEKSLLDSLDANPKQNEKVTGAFKSTRVINAHSTEMLAKGNLDFRILHRFGFVNSGPKQFWGLDQASMRLGFDYGVTNNFTVGIGRSTYRKEIDAFAKVRLLQQSTGYKAMPVTVIIAGGYMVRTEQSLEPVKPSFGARSAYYMQLVIGRKISKRLSLQLSPIFVHTNDPLIAGDDKTIPAFGIGGRYKFSKRMAFTFDYHHPGGMLNKVYTNALGMGVDIETGGHVFQLHFSNATGMNERAYVTETTGKFFKGDIRFGFNLSRVFKLGSKKKPKE